MKTATNQKALDEVKNRIDSIDTFPEEIEQPITTLNENINNVLSLTITGPDDERTLKEVAQQIRDDIVQLPGITQVDVVNVRPYEISIEVSEVSLRQFELTFNEVANAVRNGSLDLPGGSIKQQPARYFCAPKGKHTMGTTLRILCCGPELMERGFI